MIKRRWVSWARLLSAPLMSGALIACSTNLDDLQTYAERVKAREGGRIEPLPEVKPHETFLYEAQELRDPFDVVSFGESRVATKPVQGSGVSPDLNRPKEPLEEFPLDTLRMVGTLARGDDLWALIQAGDGTIHRVKPGNFAGQNHGKIIRISQDRVELAEIVPDGLGGWRERKASLALSE